MEKSLANGTKALFSIGGYFKKKYKSFKDYFYNDELEERARSARAREPQ